MSHDFGGFWCERDLIVRVARYRHQECSRRWATDRGQNEALDLTVTSIVGFVWEMDVMVGVVVVEDLAVLGPTSLRKSVPHDREVLLEVAVHWAVADVG